MYSDIIYTRVSGHFQAHQGVSLEQQDQHLHSWSERNGGRVIGYFEEGGKSGRALSNRPELAKALAALPTSGRLIISKLSRLGRNTKDVLHIAECIRDAGATLIIVDQQINTSGAMGQLFFTMLAAIAQFESDMLAEHMVDMVNFQRQKNKRWGGLPIGWSVDGGGILVPNEREREVWRTIKRYKAEGMKYHTIAERMSAEGYRARSGKPYDICMISRIARLDFSHDQKIYTPPAHYRRKKSWVKGKNVVK